MRDIITSNGLEDGCKRLIDVANERGGDDNITCVVVYVANTLSSKGEP
jgi:serine/threonine protein phosphatase PrpC